MEIYKVQKDKRAHMALLLLGDEQEDMIDMYLDRGDMFVLDENGVKAVCVVTDEGGGALELKNIAVVPECQKKGYGRCLIRFIEETYSGRYSILLAGTGDSPLTIPFYKKCGFTESHRVEKFFFDHYDHPIIECGVRLKDMIYLKKDLGGSR